MYHETLNVAEALIDQTLSMRRMLLYLKCRKAHTVYTYLPTGTTTSSGRQLKKSPQNELK